MKEGRSPAYPESIKSIGVLIGTKKLSSREGGSGPPNPHHALSEQLHLIVPFPTLQSIAGLAAEGPCSDEGVRELPSQLLDGAEV